MSLVRFRLWALFFCLLFIIIIKRKNVLKKYLEYDIMINAGVIKADGILAQLVEHLTFNQVVRGSNPRCLTNKKNLGKIRNPWFRISDVAHYDQKVGNVEYNVSNFFNFLENVFYKIKAFWEGCVALRGSAQSMKHTFVL